jgi:hypothetical protein
VKTEEGLEVDFLGRHPARGEDLVQVCADPSNPATLAREMRALAEARKEHRDAVPRLLVLDRDTMPRANTPGVHPQPAYEWLLAASDED